MAMVCPQCKASFDQRLQCPSCEVRLVYYLGGERRVRWPLPSPRGWQHSAWGRIFIGLLLAQGLYVGLRHLCVSVLLATGTVDPATLGSTLEGQLLIQALQVVNLFVGAVFAGAGQ